MHCLTKIILIALCFVDTVSGAEKIDVSQKEIGYLQNYLSNKKSLTACKRYEVANDCTSSSLKESTRHQDFNNTVHIRAKQIFLGYPVWGGDIVVHVPGGNGASLYNAHLQVNASMNGILYQNLQQDLQQSTQAYIFNREQSKLALKNAINAYLYKNGTHKTINKENSQLIVYIDGQQKAHWAFHISFYVEAQDGMPASPNYIMDAITFAIYKEWNEIKTFENIKGGGYGGNLRSGKLVYDGLTGHLPALTMQRDPQVKICYLQTNQVQVKKYPSTDVANFKCEKTDSTHNHVYWDEVGDEANGGYSPNHDALFAAAMTEAMYQSWYKLPVLSKNGLPTKITMITHALNLLGGDKPNSDYAYYDNDQQAAVFGDGLTEFYPLASIDVGAHELSHGFTEQHAGLIYNEQAGGLNESFSDMAAKTVENFTFGSNSWDIGSTVKKANGKAQRYMDKPSKDCESISAADSISENNAFDCSIDDMSQYHPFLLKHQISGIFNRVFYLIANAKNWDTKKAFDIMVKANMDYWIPNTTFALAACGVINAANDYQYDLQAVKQAFKTVQIDISQC